MARKCKSNEVRIQDGKLFVEDAEQCSIIDDVFPEMLDDKYIKSVRLISLKENWVNNVTIWQTGAVLQEAINMELTLRKEIRSGKAHWYAYRRRGGKLYKRYVGYSEQITPGRLLEIASEMP